MKVQEVLEFQTSKKNAEQGLFPIIGKAEHVFFSIVLGYLF
jgi:hypothetical protein